MARTKQQPRGRSQDDASSFSASRGSGSVFSDTLRDITNTKLDELSKRRASFEKKKASVLEPLHHLADPVERLEHLNAGVRHCFGINADKQGKVIKSDSHPQISAKLSNLDRFLAQARHDPSVSAKLLGDWEKELLRHLDTQSLKFEYATLYGRLVTEWLSGDQNAKTESEQDEEDDDKKMVDVDPSVKLAPELETKVFQSADVDLPRLRKHLSHLFDTSGTIEDGSSQEKKRALQHLRKEVEDFGAKLSQPLQFNQGNLDWVIESLLASDVLSNEKREVLKDFKGNTVILSEIADVLNMRLTAISSWAWGPGVPFEQRRRINGTYKIHLQEDLLQTIFLQYIGVQWSIFFSQAFTNFRKSRAWIPLAKEVPMAEKRRLEYYLRAIPYRRSLQKAREKIYNTDYFVARLLRDMNKIPEMVDGEVDAHFSNSVDKKRKRVQPVRRQLASMAARKTSTAQVYGGGVPVDCLVEEEQEDDEVNVEPKTPMAAKQQLLHLLSTEIAINTRLHGEHSCFHAMFEDWDTLLPHETILTVLEYFGVSESSGWLGFFKRFLQAPLQGMQGNNPRARLRGLSPSPLGDVFSEAVLFCLDFEVNQATSGQPIWRYQDDLWFWSTEHQTVVTAWKAIESFAAITGTSISTGKCGSVRVAREDGGDLKVDDLLPEGDVRWGFLVLNPRTGRFEIDQEMVDSHIDELRKQLDQKKHSIFAFIQAWNTYVATFLSSNFGTTAHCFSRQHVDDVLRTHQRIQQNIFRGIPGGDDFSAASSILDYLKKTIEQRFGVEAIPDAYFWLPTALGALDLQSPIVSLLQIRGSVLESHESLFAGMSEAEHDTYRRLKTDFDTKGSPGTRGQHRRVDNLPWTPEDKETFMSFDEFTRHREDFGILFADGLMARDVYSVFETLLKEPSQESVEPEPGSGVLDALQDQEWVLSPGSIGTWPALSPYLRWMLTVYGPEVVDRFGGLSFVDPGLLPMGMVGLFRERRMTW